MHVFKILFIEAKRFTEEQKKMVNTVKLFLGDGALPYMISVFSHCNRRQTEEPEHFKASWNRPIKALVNSMGNRWAISPNSDIFPSDNPVHKKHLRDLQNLITSIDGVYTNELLEKVREEQEKNAKITREAEKKRQKEYDDSKRKEGEDIAREKYEKQRALDARIANEKHNKEKDYIVNSLREQIRNLNEELAKLNKKVYDLENGACFELEAQVKLESGKIIQMSELQTGDRVLSNIRNGIAEYSDVYLIAHIGKLDHEEKFAKVSFTKPDGSKGNFFFEIIYCNLRYIDYSFMYNFLVIFSFRSITTYNYSLCL
jgi:hypothetical protein